MVLPAYPHFLEADFPGRLERGVQGVEHPLLQCAGALAVQAQRHQGAVAAFDVQGPAWGRARLQGRRKQGAALQIAGVEQQAQLVQSHDGVLPRQIGNLSGQGSGKTGSCQRTRGLLWSFIEHNIRYR
jgi:hypothetical protein